MWSNHREFADDWMEAWNSHDLDRVLSHYEEDVVLTSPRVRLFLSRDDGTIRGKSDWAHWALLAIAAVLMSPLGYLLTGPLGELADRAAAALFLLA